MNEKQNSFIIPKELRKIEINYLVATELLSYVIEHQNDSIITYTYGDLASKIGEGFNPQNLSDPLGVVSSSCIENNLPPISGVVVNGETRLPGEGFYREFFPSRPISEWEEIYENNVFAIKNCTLWKDFLDAIRG